MNRLPEEFLNRMKDLLGDEYDAFLRTYEREPYRALRFNPLKSDREFADRLIMDMGLRPVPWCATGYYYEGDIRPGKHPLFEAGAYYIQEPSAMLPGELASVLIAKCMEKRGFVRVLDMCAAPGGKSTHVAGAIGGNGILISNEPVPSRAKILSQNIERLGIKNCMVCVETPDKIAERFPNYFDVILTDVPCSGEGMFHRDQTAIDEWSTDNVEKCVLRSRMILDAAASCLKSDGYIVYSTCTFESAENEGLIEDFISEHKGYKTVDLGLDPVSGASKEDGWITGSGTIRLWPQRLHGEGHFVTVLKAEDADDLKFGSVDIDKLFIRGSDGTDKEKEPFAGDTLKYDRSVSNEAKKLFTTFAHDTLYASAGRIVCGTVFSYGNNLYVAHEDIADQALNGKLRTERTGLHLGEIKKGRFEPSHSLAMALGKDDCLRTVDMASDSREAAGYFEGLSLSCDPKYKGYCLVTVDGISAGWGKAGAGVLKNHYPKGLRRLL